MNITDYISLPPLRVYLYPGAFFQWNTQHILLWHSFPLLSTGPLFSQAYSILTRKCWVHSVEWLKSSPKIPLLNDLTHLRTNARRIALIFYGPSRNSDSLFPRRGKSLMSTALNQMHRRLVHRGVNAWLRWRRVRKQIIARAAAALTTATEKDHFDPFTETLFALSAACFSAA